MPREIGAEAGVVVREALAGEAARRRSRGWHG
jgi:hypothetical protein